MKEKLLFACMAALFLFPGPAYIGNSNTPVYQMVSVVSAEHLASPVQNADTPVNGPGLNPPVFSDEKPPSPGDTVELVNQYSISDTPGVLTQTDFHSRASRPGSSLSPQLTGNLFRIPVAPDGKDSRPIFLDIISNEAYALGGVDFAATFQGAAIAPDSFDEMVFFVTDDIVNWTSQEFGVRCSLKDNIIYGYVQDGNGQAGGCSFFKNVPLGTGDGTEHVYKISMQNFQADYIFNFYIDNNLAGTITRSSLADYTGKSYYVVMTTHRWENGWDSTGLGMSIKNIRAQGLSPQPAFR
jgi:hypothetical protein